MSREHKSKEKLHTLDAAPFKKILIVGRIIPMPYFVGSRAVLDVVCRCCSRLLYVMNLGHDSNLSNTSMKDGRNATRRVHVQQSRRPESNLHHCAAGRIFSAGQWSSASEPEQLRFSAKSEQRAWKSQVDGPWRRCWDCHYCCPKESCYRLGRSLLC